MLESEHLVGAEQTEIKPGIDFEVNPEPEGDSEVIYLFRGISGKHQEDRIGEWWTSSPALAEGYVSGWRGQLYVAAIRPQDIPELSTLPSRVRRTNASPDHDYNYTYILDKKDPENARPATRREKKALQKFLGQLDLSQLGKPGGVRGTIALQQEGADLIFGHTFDLDPNDTPPETETPRRARWFFRAARSPEELKGAWTDDLNEVLDNAGADERIAAVLVSDELLSQVPAQAVSLSGPIGQELEFVELPPEALLVHPGIVAHWRQHRIPLDRPRDQYSITDNLTSHMSSPSRRLGRT